jgi:hypothetical protein
LDGWFPPKSLKSISQDKVVSSMLALIRNALAHGNIFSSGSPIDRLIFVQKRDANSTFEVLSVSPSDFGDFVRGWVKFLSDSNMPELYLVA